jgi:hypothetical protein
VAKDFTQEDDDLLAELGVEVEVKGSSKYTPREERIIAGFEEIQQFIQKHGRPPEHGEEKDIFERLCAVRLDRLRAQEECRTLLAPFDNQGLLVGATIGPQLQEGAMNDEALLAALGDRPSDITELRHVRTSADKRAAEEIANRKKCEDFDQFKPLFAQVQSDLQDGTRQARPMKKGEGEVSLDDIAQGDLFIVGGQKAYVALKGDEFATEYNRRDCRLRVIYDNGTEGEVLLRSFQRALHRDDSARKITNPSAGPLFESVKEEGDSASGTIYVLRSKSDHPEVVAHREVLHKIGVTSGPIDKRIAIAKNDPTYLLADVDVVATYELFNINRVKLEKLLHRFFEPARLDITIKDRFGHPVSPREWYLVPLFIIDEVVERIRDGSISEYRYDVQQAKLVKRS